MTIKVRVLEHGKGLPLPAYETAQAAGFDLRAAIPADDSLVLHPGKRAMVPTGLQMELPVGFEMQVRPRSGLALKHGITVLNAPGTVDADYRGEVCVILHNASDEPFSVKRGDRIAQGVIQAVPQFAFEQVEELSSTERGAGGFGSTGRG